MLTATSHGDQASSEWLNKLSSLSMPCSADRSCGSCTVCCYAPAIVALNKPTGVRCGYLTDNGCGVYRERHNHGKFGDCIEFRCLWLDGFGKTGDRPDQIGAVFMAKDDPDTPATLRVDVVEAVPGAAQHPRVSELIDKVLESGRTVVIANAASVIVVKPNGGACQLAVDPDDPLHLLIDPRAVPVYLSVKGTPMRVSR